MSLKRLGRLLREALQEWGRDKSSRLAAALAYYTVFSLAPLLVIVIAIASFFFDQAAAREQITQQIQSLIGSQGAEAVGTVLDNANRPGENTSLIASLISIVILLFGATGVFVQLQDALNTIWNVEAQPQNAAKGFIRKRILSFAMLLTIGFLLIVSLVVSTAISALSGYLSSALPGFDVLWQLLNTVVSLGILTLLFALLFKYVPDVKIAWSDVWIGSLVTSVLFTIGKFALGAYLGNSGFGSAYGAAGSFILILAWVYYSAQILFFGAELTQVYARRYGSQILPDSHAVSTLPETEVSQDQE
ncbi:YihY/virulence factor BrkB family protein [Romeria aff. gracilis LEGE 07310]|uniref:YihY/virulence factor BrkB family protein n=1 Tax=Vasconcelosia minhoensis LEGE 07310 TaxID=915328 RepID=A0A8J7A7P3_9CYAN|nr:YihY/virulence factor BrkB family protein [Romeria gracilis]MBE9078512.1 YihY/virulence factor BrkB family protein [Romeria aff. gracilis LEGE 07310]